jgi:hypothetical protein
MNSGMEIEKGAFAKLFSKAAIDLLLIFPQVNPILINIILILGNANSLVLRIQICKHD